MARALALVAFVLWGTGCATFSDRPILCATSCGPGVCRSGTILNPASAVAVIKQPTGRIYPEPQSTWLEVIGVDPLQIWARAHVVLEKHGIAIQSEDIAGLDGLIRCKPFTLEIPGVVNTADYSPPELVFPNGGQKVKLRHELSFNVAAHPSGLVRLWFDSAIAVNNRPVGEVREPHVVAHELLVEIIAPFKVVLTWRHERDPSSAKIMKPAADVTAETPRK